MATGRSLTNKAGFAYALESAVLGVLPGSPVWQILEPNANISKWGAEIKTTPRDPISKLKQRRKGEVTDLDSAVEIECDLTLSSVQDFMPGMFLSKWKGPLFWAAEEGSAPVSMTATAITVPNIGSALAQGTLIRVRGASVAANNKVFLVGAGSTTTSIVITGGTVETFPANASVEVCGYQQVAGTTDIAINASGHLTSATTNFTTLPINVGQYLNVGDLSNAAFYFTTGVPSTGVNYGLARIEAIAANLITLSHRPATWSADTGTTKSIRLLFGRWIRNVAVDHADYAEPSYTFEAVYKDLGGAGVDYYEYPVGNYVDTVEISLPLTNKATVKYGFQGTNTPAPTTSRATNAANGLLPTSTAELATGPDIARLRILNTDETGLSTDFKSAKITLHNNVSREKVLGVIGAKFMNVGNFEVDLEADLLFTNFDVVTAILANRTVSMDYSLHNDDGGFVMDLPAFTMGDGKRSFPKNESIHIAVKGMSFVDPVLGYSCSLSMFPYLP